MSPARHLQTSGPAAVTQGTSLDPRCSRAGLACRFVRRDADSALGSESTSWCATRPVCDPDGFVPSTVAAAWPSGLGGGGGGQRASPAAGREPLRAFEPVPLGSVGDTTASAHVTWHGVRRFESDEPFRANSSLRRQARAGRRGDSLASPGFFSASVPRAALDVRKRLSVPVALCLALTRTLGGRTKGGSAAHGSAVRTAAEAKGGRGRVSGTATPHPDAGAASPATRSGEGAGSPHTEPLEKHPAGVGACRRRPAPLGGVRARCDQLARSPPPHAPTPAGHPHSVWFKHSIPSFPVTLISDGSSMKIKGKGKNWPWAPRSPLSILQGRTVVQPWRGVKPRSHVARRVPGDPSPARLPVIPGGPSVSPRKRYISFFFTSITWN